MNKTPVSMLQEMMAKKHTTPNYELIHDGGGSHINTFTWKVTCDGLTATGTGRCKRDAKHEAAKAMLEAIAAHHAYPQLEPSPAQSPIRTPVPPTIPPSPRIPPNVPFVNAIGTLQLLCAESNLDEPEYVLISDVGPPHAKVFTYHCVISTFCEEGIAATKKQAKHEAAKKMFGRIKDLLEDPNFDDFHSKKNSEELEQKIHCATEEAICAYSQLTKSNTTRRVNLGLSLHDAHLHIKKNMDESVYNEVKEKLECLVPSFDLNIDDVTEQILPAVKEILDIAKLTYETSEVESNDDTRCMEQLSLNVHPRIVEIGVGNTKSEALLNATLQLIRTLLLLLK